MRGVLKHAWRLGLIPAEDYQRAVDLDPIPGETLPKGRALTKGEVGALMAACNDDPAPAGVRDGALFGLLIGAGLRRSEIVNLDLTDYNREDGRLTIRAGKGRKDREMFVTGGAAEALADWLELRGSEPGPIFWPIAKLQVPYKRRRLSE